MRGFIVAAGKIDIGKFDSDKDEIVPALQQLAIKSLLLSGLFNASLKVVPNNIELFYKGMSLFKVQEFLQAIIDDQRRTVRRMLDECPQLLITEPVYNCSQSKQDKPLVIESQLTWQKFYAEKALTMAVKRRQIEMIKILLSYFEKLEQMKDVNQEEVKKAKTEGLNAWVVYTVEQKPYGQNDRIIIPEKYVLHAKSLVKAFNEECFPDKAGRFSEKTELALNDLLNTLIPENAVKLDDAIDPELFLLAILNTLVYGDFSLTSSLKSREKVLAPFFVRVIGLIESSLQPETAKVLCKGIYSVVEKHGPINYDGERLRFNRTGCHKTVKFYRHIRAAYSGLGSNYYCTAYGSANSGWDDALCAGSLYVYFQKFCLTKISEFDQIFLAIQRSASDRDEQIIFASQDQALASNKIMRDAQKRNDENAKIRNKGLFFCCYEDLNKRGVIFLESSVVELSDNRNLSVDEQEVGQSESLLLTDNSPHIDSRLNYDESINSSNQDNRSIDSGEENGIEEEPDMLKEKAKINLSAPPSSSSLPFFPMAAIMPKKPKKQCISMCTLS
jgi:hypothetical protein